MSKDSTTKREDGIYWLRNEIKLNKKIQKCEHFAKMIEVHETKESTILVFEFIQGPSLFSKAEKKNLNYKKIENVKKIMFSLLNGIKELEEHGIVHRDLKPDNLVFNKKGDYSSLKIIDFGLACSVSEVKKHELQICGTPGYIAPEVFNTEKSEFKDILNSKIDVFSAGVILHRFLYRKHPFSRKNNIIEENREGRIKIRSLRKMKTDKKCPLAHDLLWKMIHPDKDMRIGIQEALDHPFFNEARARGSLLSTKASILVSKSQRSVKTGKSLFSEEEFCVSDEGGLRGLEAVGRVLQFKNKFGETKRI